MTENDHNSDPAFAGLQDYCLRVIRFLAGTALDPHRYFEQKYCADVEVAHSREELTGILLGLVDWCNEINVAESALDKFNYALQSEGYPSLSMLCAHDSQTVGLILANGRISSAQEYQLIRDYLNAASLHEGDRSVAQHRLNEYAQ